MANKETGNAFRSKTTPSIASTPALPSQQGKLHIVVRYAILILLGMSLAGASFYLLRKLGY